jgi:hypothetical protein
VKKSLSQFKKCNNFYCSRSCAISCNNTKRRKSRRSKCEIMLYELLVKEFPTIEIISNDKTLLNGYEIDIAIPSLKLGVEWNGIVHYQPIYGEQKLSNIQKCDSKKLILAQENGIQLIVVPDLVSSKKYVKEVFYNISKTIRLLLPLS